MEAFTKALTTLKEDYTCKICLQFCKNPVTLSKCFHVICAEHFNGLKTCPICGVNLDGCTIFSDINLENGTKAAKELVHIFDDLINKPLSLTESDAPAKKNNESTQKKPTTNTALSDKTASSKLERKKSKSNTLNMSILSTGSRFNKTAEKRNTKGETMLHIACRLGKIDKVMELLNQGSNTNTKDNAGWTPLHEAVQTGRNDLVVLLLQYNTLINVPGQGNETPLHEAVRYNHVVIAEELVKHGADLNVRNCKGETPFQLANENLKTILLSAAENILQTQTVNISHISAMYAELDFDDIHVYCVSQFKTVHNKLKMLTKHHNNLFIESKMTKKVTHLIVDEEDNICQSSLDVLQGVVSSLWVLSTQWINKSSEDKLEPFQPYEIKGIDTESNQGPMNARFNKYKQLPGIFDGCHFYLHNFTASYEISKKVVLTKAILSKLITDAGGIVLRRVPNPELIPEQECLVPYHAKKGGKLYYCSHYIIYKDMYEPKYNMHHLKALPVGWLLECILKYELCEPS